MNVPAAHGRQTSGTLLGSAVVVVVVVVVDVDVDVVVVVDVVLVVVVVVTDGVVVVISRLPDKLSDDDDEKDDVVVVVIDAPKPVVEVTLGDVVVNSAVAVVVVVVVVVVAAVVEKASVGAKYDGSGTSSCPALHAYTGSTCTSLNTNTGDVESAACESNPETVAVNTTSPAASGVNVTCKRGCVKSTTIVVWLSSRLLKMPLALLTRSNTRETEVESVVVLTVKTSSRGCVYTPYVALLLLSKATGDRVLPSVWV